MQPVSIITKVVSSNPAHGEVYSIQHYVIKFVSDPRQVGGLRSSTNNTDIHDITEILLKVALNTLNQNLNQIEMISFGFYIKSININIISLKHLIDYTIISDYALPILPFITRVISIMILSSTKPVIYYLSLPISYL